MNWNEIIQRSTATGISQPLILREEMQKATLTSLSRMNAFNSIVFQGGTALRIFYNNPRFSEDLDFVRLEGENFDFTIKRRDIERFLSSEFYYLPEIKVITQKKAEDIQRLVIRSISDVQSQRLSINIELFSVPSYLNSPRILAYAPFNPVVQVEKAEEILADKIIAIALREYLKGRDIWDIFYLTTELRTLTDSGLIEKKARDYGVTDVWNRVMKGRARLLDGGLEALDREMKRFLPASTYGQIKGNFGTIIESVSKELLKYVESGLR